MNRFSTILAVLALVLLAPMAEALACATCMPNPDDPIARAADASVLFLGGVVVSILGMILSFFGYLAYRSRNPLLDPAQLIAEAESEVPVDHEIQPRHA
jgi:hypothetical protein